jgi:flotillin
MKSVPPLSELFEQAGMSLPEYLGKKKEVNDNNNENQNDNETANH